MSEKHTDGPWLVMIDQQSGIGRTHAVYICAKGDWPESQIAHVNVQDGFNEREANARLIVAAPDLLAACQWVDDHAPSREPRDGPTVGFQPSRDPEQDDGNDTVREAFDEGVTRGLWLAANSVRAAIARATVHP